MYKISMVSLGCPKNQVDAEMMLASLKNGGYEIAAEETEADAIIINTCGFIEDAKKEAIENILEAARYKKTGKCRALIVTGCLARGLFVHVGCFTGANGRGRQAEVCASPCRPGLSFFCGVACRCSP